MASSPCFKRLFTHNMRYISNIGFIGLEKIGYGMANNISSKHNLFVYDIDKTQCIKFKEEKNIKIEYKNKIEIASSISNVALNTNILFTVLPDDKILCDIVENELYKN